MNIVSICYISGVVFQEIKYKTINDLNKQLKLLIIYHDSDILSSVDNYNIITIVFNQKKELYCLCNQKGKYILDYIYTDNYSKLLFLIINFYKNDSHNIIINSSYKNLLLKIVKKYGLALKYASIPLKNDKEVVLEAVKQNGLALQFVNINLKNDEEIILEAVKQNGDILRYLNKKLRNNKTIVFEAVKYNGFILDFAKRNLQNDIDIVLEAVKQNGNALQYANIDLQNDKDIILYINNI